MARETDASSFNTGGPPTRARKRSHAGCSRCKRRRQGCDQQKPSCSRCLSADSQCTYEVRLRWGGKPFGKSTFGNCLNNVERLESESAGGFVYGIRAQTSLTDHKDGTQPSATAFDIDTTSSYYTVSTSRNHLGDFHVPNMLTAPPSSMSEAGEVPIPPSLTDGEPNRDEHSIPEERNQTDMISRPLGPMTRLPPTAKYLLQYYLLQTTRLTVPSDYARDEICRFVVPMALENRPLLFAIMTFAAVHLHSNGMLSGEPERLIDKLHQSSIQSLQPTLHDRDSAAQALSLATTRTLCQAMIYRGTSSWRVHLDNARSILQHAHFRNGATQNCSCSAIHGFLSSWYDNTEALAALTPLGLRHGQLEVKCLRSVDVQFDVFGGTASDLPGLLREVGAMVKEKRSRRRSQSISTGSGSSILSDSDIDLEAEALVREVRRRLERDTVSNLICDRHLPAALSGDDVQDYVLSNAGYLYTALLYIYIVAFRHSRSRFQKSKMLSMAWFGAAKT